MDESKDSKALMRKRFESHRKRTSVVAVVAAALLVAGIVGVLASATEAEVYARLIDNDHLTDDGIAVRDLENATYTWTSEELLGEVTRLADATLIGIILSVVGYAGCLICVILGYSPKKTHLIQCDGSGEKKYCPECGLKLSKLEEK